MHAVAHALSVAGSMAWEITWALILGFLLSAIVQAVVRKSTVARWLGDDRARTLAVASLFGAASSSWTEPRLDDVRAVKLHRRATVTAQVAMMLILFVVVLRACA